MFVSPSISAVPIPENFTAFQRHAPDRPIAPGGIGQRLAALRRRRAERRMVAAVGWLGHPGLLADLQRARQG